MTIDYRIPAQVFWPLVIDWLRARPRNFRADACVCVDSLTTPISISGHENLVCGGPLLVTFNHYHRPGFSIWWLVMAITAALQLEPAARLGVVISAEWTYPGKWYAALGRWISRLVIRRLAFLYGFIPMPPMPPRAQDLAARAGAVRAVLSFLSQMPCPVLLLAPEGADQADGFLGWPPQGVGRFVSLMTAHGLRILPVAGWEQAGRLCLRFGQPYQLSLPQGLARGDLDRAASRVVMDRIAVLLPERLSGEFGQAACKS